jgi:hypothetical protein
MSNAAATPSGCLAGDLVEDLVRGGCGNERRGSGGHRADQRKDKDGSAKKRAHNLNFPICVSSGSTLLFTNPSRFEFQTKTNRLTAAASGEVKIVAGATDDLNDVGLKVSL